MLKAANITHRYGTETVLHNISLEIETESFNVITGESGSGKSTLLSILSTLLKPTEGEVIYEHTPVEHLSNIDRFRNTQIGFVFQFHYLISHLTVLENVCLASKKPKSEALHLLDKLGIAELADKYPDALSGGERQRAAIARAVMNRPRYLFADEPTGNLDSRNSIMVFDMLREMGTTVIVATHDHSLIKGDDRVIEIKDGRLC